MYPGGDSINKIISGVFSFILAITIIVLLGYGCCKVLVISKAPPILIYLEIVIFISLGILCAVQTIHEFLYKKARLKEYIKIVKIAYSTLLLIGFAVVGIFLLISENAPIFIVIFMLVSVTGIVPIVRKKLGYLDTRILVTKWLIKVMVVFLLISILCVLAELPIFDWTF
jgi:hypothetical protein